jgi:hypothetical protein
MADTTYLKREVETFVRRVLAERFGQPFSSERLRLLPGGLHEFDAVSADRTIVVGIKSASGRTSGGNVPAAKLKDCLAEVYFLTQDFLSSSLLVAVLTTSWGLWPRRTQQGVAGAGTTDEEVVPFAEGTRLSPAPPGGSDATGPPQDAGRGVRYRSLLRGGFVP